jgi:ribulose-5-phosphate 4-epimerase/fuculose-1-phosphate aldolase
MRPDNSEVVRSWLHQCDARYTGRIFENSFSDGSAPERLATVALMRGHGNVVVGRSLPEVVFRSVYTEANARLQADALRLGDGRVTYLSDGEAAASMATNAGVLTRAWGLWKASARG